MSHNLEHDACALVSKRFKYNVEDLRSEPLNDSTIFVYETTNGTAWQVKVKNDKLVIRPLHSRAGSD